MLVVIGISPAVDVSVVVGPFRSEMTAMAASDELTHKGYVTETCPLYKLTEVEPSGAWDGD